jgi:hypothetical protein
MGSALTPGQLLAHAPVAGLDLGQDLGHVRIVGGDRVVIGDRAA